ncbi:glycoside hydrolase superfamily [Mycena alexandri]|uniref:Alpha-galactosidase n=1 Tax=Mycena alexandri TaxID=1745969 RepID=A0AAD6TJN0_9AGAR|nr:glycoside hydrolase superfamily [Mycena alexandri]
MKRRPLPPQINLSLGLKAAGYQHINIDDCWSLIGRNTTNSQIIPDPAKFPNGISSVATQVRALGLKFGIYSDAGTATCSGFPGSLGLKTLMLQRSVLGGSTT